MSEGFVETGKRIAEEAPEMLQGQQNEGLVSKIAGMMDMDDPSLRVLDGILNTSLFFGLLGGGLDAFADAGDVLSQGNGADLVDGLSETMERTFGNSPDVVQSFDLSGAAVPQGPAPGAAPAPAAPANAPGSNAPGMAPSLIPGGPGSTG
jgi:hypothetical protein